MESKPIRERLLPQTSIRFFLLLIGGCAVLMYIFRAATVGDAFWAKIVSLLITIVILSFVVYLCVFLVANLFTTTTSSLLQSGPPPIDSEATSSSNGVAKD